MATIMETIQKRSFLPRKPLKDDLPTFHSQHQQKHTTTTTATHLIGLRKRLSSFSVKIQPISSASSEWAFRKSKSMPSLSSFSAAPIKKWWDWGLAWILSRKPGLARDLEMNEEEIATLGHQNRGSLRHVLYRFQSGIRKLVLGSDTLPVSQKISYQAFGYNNGDLTNGNRMDH